MLDAHFRPSDCRIPQPPELRFIKCWVQELISLGVVEQEEAGGRSTSYMLKRVVEEKTAERNEAGDN